jgi:hypothetical protein
MRIPFLTSALLLASIEPGTAAETSTEMIRPLLPDITA